MEGRVGGRCKIRKRGCSSSSSSSLAHKYRFKRAILVGKRGGSSTPVPTWKVNSRSPSSALKAAESAAKGKEASVSARKLAATLWEINDVKEMRNQKESRSKERVAREWIDLGVAATGGEGRRFLRSFRRLSVIWEGWTLSALPVSWRFLFNSPYFGKQVSEFRCTTVAQSVLDPMQTETQSRGRTHSGCIVGVKTRLKDVSNGLATSKELLKVLNRIWGLEEKNSSSIPVVSALRLELDRARTQVDQLIREQRSNRDEINYLLKHFAEEKAAWKSKERARIREAIASIAGELDVEKKLRRQTERLNKKLGEELGHIKASLSKALKELKSEKRAREILEQMCDELAQGIGEDRAEVEELKRESAKVREEVEKEREMLQLADVLREERVQMKLSEAKYQFEEKNAAVDKLRHELEAYLRSKSGNDKNNGSPNPSGSEELEDYLRKALMDLCQDREKEEDDGEVENAEECEADDSAETRATCGVMLAGLRLRMTPTGFSVDREIRGRKPTSGKIQWGNISLERVTSNGMEWDFDNISQENSYAFDKGRTPEHDSEARRKDYEDEIKRYKSVKGLRDHILSGSKVSSIQGFASPTRKWEQASPLQDCSSVVLESLAVVQGSGFKGGEGGRNQG
uniref:Uncharacterized protein n=1 Tax=Vitis vinifera TaxID=29760 RepID=A5BS09_VITVI|nr:hypothetical protein VITISV_019055 [Vitis vinifera]